MKVKLNHELTKVFQDFENFATIVSKAFGGSDKGSSKASVSSNGEKRPMTADEIIRGVAAVNAARKGK